MQSATIKLFLITGSPSGLRTAELSNWSGKGIAAPRSEVTQLARRPELKNPGIYILTGEDADSGDTAVYVGEAEDVAKRLKQHSSKDFWNSAVVFVSKDENLTKAHIRYLEGRLIERAQRASSAVVVNSMSSGSKLPESDSAEMEVFMEKCLQLLPVLGVSVFRQSSSPSDSGPGALYCRIKGLVARGRRTETGFVVFQGSQAVMEHRSSARSIRKLRDRLLEKGVLSEQNGHLRFERDQEFGSPSTAGGVVRGGNTNGLLNWKDELGTTLRDLEA